MLEPVRTRTCLLADTVVVQRFIHEADKRHFRPIANSNPDTAGCVMLYARVWKTSFLTGRI